MYLQQLPGIWLLKKKNVDEEVNKHTQYYKDMMNKVIDAYRDNCVNFDERLQQQRVW